MRLLVILSLLCCTLASAESQDRSRKTLAIYHPSPKYPYAARQQHCAGIGIFVLYVRPDGAVSSVEVAQSTGYSILDQSRIEAFRQWRFRPGIVKSVKIPVTWGSKGVRFREVAPTVSRVGNDAVSEDSQRRKSSFIQTEPLPVWKAPNIWKTTAHIPRFRNSALDLGR